MHKLQSLESLLATGPAGRRETQVDNPADGPGFRRPQQGVSQMWLPDSSAHSWYVPAAWVVWYQNEIQRPEGAWVQIATNFLKVPSGAPDKPTG